MIVIQLRGNLFQYFLKFSPSNNLMGEKNIFDNQFPNGDKKYTISKCSGKKSVELTGGMKGIKNKQKVKFSDHPITHVMYVWKYAYKTARMGPWEQCARDHIRFSNKINVLGEIIEPILKKSHREKIHKLHLNTTIINGAT